MKKRKIILGLLIISLIPSLIGCGNKSDKLNQTEVSNDEELNIKEGNNEELKIVSNSKYNTDGEVLSSVNDIYYNSKGDLILQRRARQIGDKDEYNIIKLEDGLAKVLSQNARDVNMKYTKGNLYADDLSDGKVKIYNNIGDEGYIIDSNLLNKENCYYTLLDDILVTWVSSEQDVTIIKTIKIYNLSSGANNEITFDKNVSRLRMKQYKNKLFILYSSDEKTVQYCDRVMVIDIQTNKIEEDLKISPIQYIIPLDETRFLYQDSEYEYGKEAWEGIKLYIYDIKSKVKKELMQWDKDTYWRELTFSRDDSIVASPLGNKIIFREYKENKVNIKVAEVKGMTISEPVTVYETDKEFGKNLLFCFSEDSKSVTIFDRMSSVIITKVEFNK